MLVISYQLAIFAVGSQEKVDVIVNNPFFHPRVPMCVRKMIQPNLCFGFQFNFDAFVIVFLESFLYRILPSLCLVAGIDVPW